MTAALWSLAGPVPAENMTEPGRAPDIGFAGLWRIIDARFAPWARAGRPTAAEAPLLEDAVDFAEGEVKGPAPLACKAATYSNGVAGRDELFGGKLAGDADGAMAKALDLRSPTIFRTSCQGLARDYYLRDDADLTLAMGDVVYTLQRPTGMDPERFKAGYSGPSFDCAKARATGDRLICIDAHLAAADRKLGEAYKALRKAESAEAFETFRVAERAWRDHVMEGCGANGPMPDYPGPIVDCLTTEYGDRADLLGDLTVARAGAMTLEPRTRFRTREAPDTEESDIYPRLSGGPGAAAFNAYVSGALRLGSWRMDDKTLFRYDAAEVGDQRLHARRSYEAKRLDARVVSLGIITSDFVGGHDEERDETALSWDLARSRPIGLGDVFAGGSGWKPAVAAYALKSLRRQLDADGMSAEAEPGEVAKAAASAEHWLWAKDHATLLVPVFLEPGYRRVLHDVDIPYKWLERFMKPGAPVR
jgi:uncharacterized protein YecT (DUF1311 family)